MRVTQCSVVGDIYKHHHVPCTAEYLLDERRIIFLRNGNGSGIDS